MVPGKVWPKLRLHRAPSLVKPEIPLSNSCRLIDSSFAIVKTQNLAGVARNMKLLHKSVKSASVLRGAPERDLIYATSDLK
jgi:hypothetical protein